MQVGQLFNGVVIAMAVTFLSGCGAQPHLNGYSEPRFNSGRQASSEFAAQQRPLTVSPETSSTVCIEDEKLPIREKNSPMAFFGIFVDLCVGVIPGDVTPLLVVVGYDEIRGHSPARDAGLQAGDVLAAFNGCRMSEVSQVESRMQGFTPGNVAEVIAIRREGQRHIALPIQITTVALKGRTRSPKHCMDIGLASAAAFLGN